MNTSGTAQFSWEYILGKQRKERVAGYIRESNENLMDSNTIDSQAKAVRLYAEKEGYIYPLENEYREAVSAYMIPYTQRPKLLELLAAAKRGEFTVLIVSEIRALSRKQVEVFVLYDMLQKYGVRLETIQEKFEDSAIGRFILATRAMVAELERENTYMRTQRGKQDRLENGAMNGHPKPAYGLLFIDTKREQKAEYAFNHAIIYIDRYGVQWSEYRVCLFIFDLLRKGESMQGVVKTLNDLGIPPPMKAIKGEAHWQTASIRSIVSNPVYIGEVWANRYKKAGKTSVLRPKEEWVRLPDCPAMIDRETFEAVQKQLAYNKQDSLRNNKHIEELGLLRSGYCRCGICGRAMSVQYPSPIAKLNSVPPLYRCRQTAGKNFDRVHNHSVHVNLQCIDALAKEKIIEIVQSPEMVRARVAEMRQQNKPIVDREDIEATIADLDKQIQNLFALARHATNDDTLQRLGQMMNELEKQKQQADAMLYVAADDEEEKAAIEAELVRFEEWAANVKGYLANPAYCPDYSELRLAVRILGLVFTIYPPEGDGPARYQIDVTIPEIMAKLHSGKVDTTCFSPRKSPRLTSVPV